MHFHWYPFYPGDYAADTSDLSCEEHGCYRLLLDASWSRGPLPNDLDRLRRLTANPPAETVRYILERFWSLIEDGWICRKLEKVRSQQSKQHEKQVVGGLMTAWKVHHDEGSRLKLLEYGVSVDNLSSATSSATSLLPSNQNQNQNQNQKPDSKSKKKGQNNIAPRGAKNSTTKNLNFNAWPQSPNPEQWAEILENRKKKKARNSQRAFDNLGRKIRKAMDAGYTFQECLDEWETKQWSGFDDRWMDNAIGEKRITERNNEREIRDWINEKQAIDGECSHEN